MAMSQNIQNMMTRGYEDNGYVFPLDGVTPDAAAELRRDLETAERELADDPEKLQLLRTYPDRLLPSFDALVRHERLVSAAIEILGPDLIVWSSAVFIKEAASPNIVSWHQDLTYWGLDDVNEVTCWVALSQATRRSGAMKFVPGSHKRRAVAHVDTWAENNMLSRGQEVAVDVDERQAVTAELRPGQFSMHHGHMFHASGPNTSDDRRIGAAIRYMAASMRQRNGFKPLVAHVAGNVQGDHLNVVANPLGRLHEDDFERCRQDALGKRKIFYKDSERPAGGQH